jgi:hypothetical protein
VDYATGEPLFSLSTKNNISSETTSTNREYWWNVFYHTIGTLASEDKKVFLAIQIIGVQLQGPRMENILC